VAKSYLPERTTIQDFFKVMVNNLSKAELRSPKLVGIMSDVLNLTHNQVRQAFHELEKRRFITVAKAPETHEITEVDITNRNWTAAPKSTI